ncbi:hypothetical protein BJ170DRAFT_490093 [Xylariales sp. AK1849]|nr:hypothetical protein BJ170DRAFT_490093 [Xylariales sp. AK1849]
MAGQKKATTTKASDPCSQIKPPTISGENHGLELGERIGNMHPCSHVFVGSWRSSKLTDHQRLEVRQVGLREADKTCGVTKTTELTWFRLSYTSKYRNQPRKATKAVLKLDTDNGKAIRLAVFDVEGWSARGTGKIKLLKVRTFFRAFGGTAEIKSEADRSKLPIASVVVATSAQFYLDLLHSRKTARWWSRWFIREGRTC